MLPSHNYKHCSTPNIHRYFGYQKSVITLPNTLTSLFCKVSGDDQQVKCQSHDRNLEILKHNNMHQMKNQDDIKFWIARKRPISEFPSQTCALLLLSLHSVCHVTIAHCNDSNGTDTRVRVLCNDSDVTDRKQSRVCNDSTVTDISWAIATCDGHTNCWQSCWKPQKWNYPL